MLHGQGEPLTIRPIGAGNDAASFPHLGQWAFGRVFASRSRLLNARIIGPRSRCNIVDADCKINGDFNDDSKPKHGRLGNARAGQFCTKHAHYRIPI